MESSLIREIVTLPHPCLTKKAEPIADTVSGLQEAIDVIRHLENALHPHMPAAGLAAPQIGISKQVFIFSWNRTSEPEAVINPSFEAVNDDMTQSWEGCFSTPLAMAQIPRYQMILATYTNRQGDRVTYRLSGFAARAFQHEYDHLTGTITVHRKDAVIRHFKTQEERQKFLAEIKKGDQADYRQPEKIEG
ncbi:MAG: Peptide deformylase [Alphaproteobacteria bacterium]|nr:Peptide deformylase [Alphaproteobacteria bacterium]